MLEQTASLSESIPWLIRIPSVFDEFEAEILGGLRARPVKKIGRDFHLVRLAEPDRIRHPEVAKFIRWNLPVDHSWPCCPKETPGFIEKAAQAVYKKFGGRCPQAILTGPLDPSAEQHYYRTLASNLRGRMLQIFPPVADSTRNAEHQDSRAQSLFCMVGKEGLFCGMQSPLDCNGFYPGGTKFIRQNDPATISRAGAKVAEALHHMRLYRTPPPEGAHWLELGASPGGMTAELLAKKYQVTAVDRAPLDVRLAHAPGLIQMSGDAATFRPEKGVFYDALLSDMNGDAQESMKQIIRLSRYLKPGGLVIFTLKTPGASTFDALNALEESIIERATGANLAIFARTHLTYNRHEFTLFFEFSPAFQNE